MADATLARWSGLKWNVTPDENGLILEAGIGAELSSSGMVVIQFDPSIDFVGSFQVLARMGGQIPENEIAPWVPVPYRLLSLGGIAQGRQLALDNITQSAIIEVPSNGLTIALLIAITQGFCDCFKRNLDGPSTG